MSKNLLLVYSQPMQNSPLPPSSSTSTTNSDQPLKRRRIKQACDYCRSKKAKCDGKAPSCTNCIASNEECIYSQPSKRRGLPTGYTHDLEKRVLLFKALLASLIQDDKLIESKIWNVLYNAGAFMDHLAELEIGWENHSVSLLFNKVFQDHNSVIHVSKSHKPNTTKSNVNNGLVPSETKLMAMAVMATTVAANSRHSSVSESIRLSPTSAFTPGPGTGVSNPPQPSIPAQPQISAVLVPNSVSGVAGTPASAPPVLNTGQGQAQAQALGAPQGPPLVQQQLQPTPPRPLGSIQPSPNSAFGSFMGSNNYPNTPSPAVSDPAFFFNYDVFQFISDEIECADDNNPENWEPVALQYHGLSSLISGFTNKVVQQYNSKINNVFKNPFRVGSIFNVSSFAINASMSQSVKFPSELFEFPTNIRELMDVYFQVPHCHMPMLDKVSFIRHVNYLLVLPERKRNAIDGNMLALVWAVLALGEFTMIGGDSKIAALYAKYSTMALENSFTTTIETIQAMIILGLTYYQLGQWDFSWVLISSGTRMAIDVRLMRNASDDDSNQKFQSSASLNNINRQRTWASVYMVNTLLCSRMGRSPVVRAHDWPVPQINSDGWEEWQSWECYYSSEVPKVESGKFLSMFNEVLKGISILNLAITSTIDTNVFEGDEIKFDDRQNSQSMSLELFNAKIESWKAQLPDHCRVEYYGNGLVPPPPVVSLHLLENLIWCILAVRLSSLKGNSEIKDKIIKFRDQKYTAAIRSIKSFINARTLHILNHYFLFDYYVVMSFNFPDMMDFETELMKQSHISDMQGVLMKSAANSVPCRICWDLFTIMKSLGSHDVKDTPKNNITQDTPTAQESPMISNLLNEPISVKTEHPADVKQPGTVPPSQQQEPTNVLPGIIPHSAPNSKSWVNQLPPPTATTLTLPLPRIVQTQGNFPPDANLVPIQHPVHQPPMYHTHLPVIDHHQQQYYQYQQTQQVRQYPQQQPTNEPQMKQEFDTKSTPNGQLY
ncbi:Quinic acid utilization activator [Candida viswanathii]|uniref:Quinic acid utilization activator n=1 Tax=Candida viswanathii TaxID=5486 RepID=A0A367XNX8_9ASCO|nr:Quinic acid utilization activator [Candida viswanathii]